MKTDAEIEIKHQKGLRQVAASLQRKDKMHLPLLQGTIQQCHQCTPLHPLLQNRKVLVVCNLKPASMRGIKSQAMVLAASNDDHTIVELVSPPEDAPVGERLKFPGFDGEPDEVLNPKKKIWETVQPDLHTTTDLIACSKASLLPHLRGCAKFPLLLVGP